jgi:hypothetical protein
MDFVRAFRLLEVFYPGYARPMTLFTRSLWPEGTRRPFLRLAGAFIAAPLLMAAALTLLAFLFAGSTEPTREGTMAVTREAAVWLFGGLSAFSLSFGLAGVALLWALGQRSILAWLLAGAGTGALLVTGLGLLTADGIDRIQIIVAMVLGLALFFLIRWIAGIRLN